MFYFFQVSLEADMDSEPGYIGVRGVHVIPGYCHPLPLRANRGTKVRSTRFNYSISSGMTKTSARVNKSKGLVEPSR